LSKFTKNNRRKDKLNNSCKYCDKIYRKKWNHSHPENIKKSRNNFYKNNTRFLSLKKLYDISITDYNKMFEEQNGCCQICNKHQSKFKRSLSVDHCHITGKVRGLLCGPCNTAIGMLKDDTKIIESALNYLNKYKSLILKVVK
jgi:hypothetical protein